jgi:hypothetical protein
MKLAHSGYGIFIILVSGGECNDTVLRIAVVNFMCVSEVAVATGDGRQDA